MGTSPLSILGIFIGLEFVLITVGVFTPAWVCGYDGYWDDDECIGIVPFYSEEVTWYACASWLMFISFSASLILLFLFYKANQKVKKNDYCCHTKKWFNFIAGLSFFIMLLTVIAVALVGIYLNINSDYIYSYNIGYSAWLCVAAGVFNLATCVLSFYISRKYCN